MKCWSSIRFGWRQGILLTLPGAFAVSGMVSQAYGGGPIAEESGKSASRKSVVRIEDKIAFIRNNSIYVMNANGSGKARLIVKLPNDHYSISPDGRKVVFSKMINVEYDVCNIFVVDLNSGKRHTLVKGGDSVSQACAGQPSFSPDGKKVVFSASSSNPAWIHSKIYIVDADGSNLRQLTNNQHDISPTFSPDGKKVIFMSNVGTSTSPMEPEEHKYELFQINLDGTNQIRITSRPISQDKGVPSLGGKKIAFVREDDIFVKNVDNTGEMRLTRNPKIDDSPIWRPDSKMIAWRSNRTGRHQIYVMNADGTGQRRLTNESADVYPVHWR